jgi:AraC-like DNA-binding protein
MTTPPSAFFLVGAATAYFTLSATQILFCKNRNRLQTTLGWIFVLWAILNLKDIILVFPEYNNKETIKYILLIDGWSIITYYIFLYELTKHKWTTWRKVLLFCLPFAVFSIIYIVFPTNIVLNTYVVFLWLCAAAFFVIGFVKSKKYIKYIHDNYSNIDEIDISWLKYMFFFAFLEQSLYFINAYSYNSLIDILYYASAIGMWQIARAYGTTLKPINIIEPTVTPKEMESKGYSFAGNIEKKVEGEELYLNKDLTLTDLAKAIGTNRTYLSDYFCNHKHTTFYDYINQLRIEQMAIPMIQQHPEYTVEYVASESGFKHVSTFRRAFTKLTGKSPSQYRSELDLT